MLNLQSMNHLLAELEKQWERGYEGLSAVQELCEVLGMRQQRRRLGYGLYVSGKEHTFMENLSDYESNILIEECQKQLGFMNFF